VPAKTKREIRPTPYPQPIIAAPVAPEREVHEAASAFGSVSEESAAK
jgi:hypothetical protein